MRGVKQTRHGWGGRRGCVPATAALIATLTLLLPLTAHPRSPARAASPPPLPLSLVLYGARDLSPLTARFAAAYQARHPDLLLYVTASTLHPGFDNACGERDGATPVGKGAGVIGVSDVFIENDQLVLASCQDMINVPFAIGAVAAVYNLPGRYFARRAADGLTPLHPLRLSAPLIADIYAGRVARWDDPAIARLNPGAPLPPARIYTVASADPGSVALVFDQWLAASDSRWPLVVDTTFTQEPTQRPVWPATVGITETDNLAVYTIQHHPYALGFTSVQKAWFSLGGYCGDSLTGTRRKIGVGR